MNETHELILDIFEWKEVLDVESLFEGMNPFSTTKSDSNEKLKELRGILPNSRCWHSSTLIDKSAIIIGGCGNSEYFNDIFKYQFLMQKWFKIPLKMPNPIAKHSSVFYEDSIFIFGGMYYDKKFEINNDLYEISSLKEIKKIEIFGEIPSPRFGHSAVIYKNNMYIFGGENEKGTNNELFEFNFDTKKWTKIETKGDIPKIRSDHSCTVYGDSMIIIGGLESFDHIAQNLSHQLVIQYFFEKKEWKLINFSGDFPLRISQHTAVLHQDEIIIFGGMSWNYKLNNALYTLNCKDWTFQNLNNDNSERIEQWQKENFYMCHECADHCKFKIHSKKNKWFLESHFISQNQKMFVPNVTLNPNQNIHM